ncbi:hypothetical protein HU200_046652 [Digitaria exilis]|uniref:Uncharacterized protein n=1 Tax=Digitaria exilis TaxID=1010633 RepID=A0A835EAZ4_9POAL|nr:hypothetical protein HU200_046652 [Digitaria exilis]
MLQSASSTASHVYTMCTALTDLRDDKQFFVLMLFLSLLLRYIMGVLLLCLHECYYINSKFQNVKGVFDAAIKVVLQPPKAKKKKKAQRGACSIL